MSTENIWLQLAARHAELSASHAAIRELYVTMFDNEQAAVDGYGAEPIAAQVAEDTSSAPAASALELFTGKPAAQGEPVYTMTDLAGVFTREQYHAQNWTDEMLVSNGYMTVEYPKPAAPQPPAAPTPPAPPSAPTTASAPASPTPAGTEVFRDKAGVPWDGRIHSTGRTINEGDGLWKKKKGVSAQLVAQVTSELLAAKPAAAAAPFTAPAPQPAAPVPAAAPAAPAAPTPAAAPQASAAPGTAEPTDFNSLIMWQKANNISATRIVEVASQMDPAIVGLGFLARPEYSALIPTVVQLLKV